MSTIHVEPVADVIEHEDSEDCPCGPDIEFIPNDDAPDGWLITHHAFDGREAQ